MRRRVFLIAAALALVLLGFVVLPSIRGPSKLLAWTAGQLPSGFAASARQLPGVSAAAEVSIGTAWLSSWADADAPAPSTPPAGFRVPVEVAAIDPEQYAAFVPRDSRSRFLELSQGGALLGSTGAALRGIDDRGTLQIRSISLPVKGVVDDDLVASHEMIVSRQTGVSLGIEDPKYLLLALRLGADVEEITEGLQKLLPSGKHLGVRRPGEAPVFRPGGALLPQAQLKTVFGEFSGQPGKGSALSMDPNWIEANTTNASIPLLGVVRCHKAIIPQLKGAFDEIVRAGLSGLVRRGDFAGCFAPRFLSSDQQGGISHHAWGVAFDINASQNPLGAKPRLDRRLVEIIERWGFTWGGRWLIPDGMHFEYLTEPEE
jgi:hypothetical protein